MRGSDLDIIRKRLDGATGKQFWRSLEELADSAEFREMLHREFPVGACEPDNSVSRRNFLRLMGASLALAGASGGCWRQPEEKILPYTEQPEILVPGKPLFFATAFNFRGYGIGALVESHMGRPTKIEGNPDHPASLGATNAFMQASILSLYDPDRSQSVTRGPDVSTWETFVASIRPDLNRWQQTAGGGLRILSGTITSPTLVAQMQSLLEAYPQARWHRFDPVGRENVFEGARQAFGRAVEPIYQFHRADVIVSLDANFLLEDPGSIRYAREFVQRRRVPRSNDPAPRDTAQIRMNRLFVAEACPSITGAMADSRLPVRAGLIQSLALALTRQLAGDTTSPEPALSAMESHWIAEVVDALARLRGASLVIAGDQQPPIVHALAHAINSALGNVGATVRYVEPIVVPPEENESLAALVRDIDAGVVDTLVILDSNPVYTAPADLRFVERMKKVRQRIHLGMYHDETAAWCQWHIPQTHYLESWSDTRAFDGLPTIVQPLIHPLYGTTRTAHELLAILLGRHGSTNYQIVREYWRTQFPGERFEVTWRESLHQGFVADAVSPPADVTVDSQALAEAIQQTTATTTPTQPQADGSIELVFRPDPSVWDGSYSNNGWLQELPKPLTKLTWDNALYISPAMAQRMQLANEDVVGLSYHGRELNAAVFVVPGHADHSVSLTLGYGRRHRHMRVGQALGFNAYALRTNHSPHFGNGLTITKAARKYPLATTQSHFTMEGRDFVRTLSPQQLAHRESEPHRLPLSIYPDEMPSDPPYRAAYQWGMSIDLSSCIGCNACVVACQAENNIPIVGKEGVRNSREMHWLRIDTYYAADPGTDVSTLDNPEVYFQPLPCMQCEKAPCEVVCPVAATTHSDEGISEMTYNRCIGTRYCSNNCPYKVRRFNFFEYSRDDQRTLLALMRNPDVTVRTRGVMEKCTYCIQRINNGRIDAEKQHRRIHDGEVITACAQACPTQAIVFGDITDPKAQVYEMKSRQPFSKIDYGLLNEELGTRPRTTYLPRLVAEEKAQKVAQSPAH